jgi:hypothetical protein
MKKKTLVRDICTVIDCATLPVVFITKRIHYEYYVRAKRE